MLFTIGLCKPHLYLAIQSVQSSRSVKTQVCALVDKHGKHNDIISKDITIMQIELLPSSQKTIYSRKSLIQTSLDWRVLK